MELDNVVARAMVRVRIRRFLATLASDSPAGRDVVRWLKRAVAVNNKRRKIDMGKLKVMLETATGKVYHDKCFDEGESRDGYEEADLNELDADVECESCSAPIFGGPDNDDDPDDDDDESDDETAA